MALEQNLLPVLKALTTFEAAARYENFTTAAQTLNMEQPSVSRYISILEDFVGVSLFVRNGSRIQLTPQGKKLYETTSLSLNYIRTTIDELTSDEAENEVSICSTHGFAHIWIIPRIEHLQSLLTDRKLKLVTSEPPGDFKVEQNRIVVRFGAGDWEDGKAHLLFHEQVMPVCSPEFAKRHNLINRNIDPGELAHLPLLVQDHGEHGWIGWPGWFSHFGIENTQDILNAHKINNYAFSLQAAMEGRGIALAWENLIDPYLSNNWLFELPGLSVKTSNSYHLVTKHQDKIAKIASRISEGLGNLKSG
ncbi:MAG: LysR family transcriptional regulator [Hyphomicrobiales bacterium]|nr:LysR family transcriptional regulator [Hyphomicrobiales bacterium]